MRNLKRALSLALASVMLLGMMVVGTSAASYPDIDENDNVEAIEVLNAVNVMIGRQGNFEPDEAVNRHEMAVIMAKLVLGVDTADNYVGTHPFTDVVPWADKYVAACYENGLVAGTSATTYGGTQPLSAVQAAAMMLRALGYKDLSKNAPDWRAPVTAMANQIRLFNGVASNPSEQLNRNQVAQLALNTLKSPVVNLKDNTISWTDGEGQIIMTGGDREYIVRSSSEAYAQAINRTESSGTSASQIRGFTVELGEHLYNGKLQLRDVTDVFGRPARHWEYDGKVIGEYAKEELLVKDYVGKVTGKDLYDLLGSDILTATGDSAYDLIVHVDGVKDHEIVDRVKADPNRNTSIVFDKVDLNRNNKAAVGATGTGVQTEVYVDHLTHDIYVAIINTYLAIADKDYDTKKEETPLTIYGVAQETVDKEYVKLKGDKEPYKLGVEEFAIAADMSKDDSFLVTLADQEIQTIVPAEVVSGATLSAFKLGDHVVSGGTDYIYTTTATYKAGDLDQYTGDGKENLKDRTYDIYLDAYGNLIGLKEIEAKKNYVFISGLDRNGSNLVNRIATANAVFLDGTSDTIQINMTKSTWNDVVYNDQNTEGEALLNTWCTYTKSGDIYTVKEVYSAGNSADPDYTGTPNYTTDKTKGNTTGTSQFHQTGTTTGREADKDFEISLKNLRLDGGGTAANGFRYVYGDSDSVYLTAELDELRWTDGNGNIAIVTGAETVSTGIIDTSISVWDVKGAAAAAEDSNVKGTIPAAAGNVAHGVYTLYDKDGTIIAVMAVGEGSSAKDLVYVHSDSLDLESDNGNSSRAAGDGLWTWSRRVIRDGQEVTLTEVGDDSDKLESMLQYHWYEVRTDGNGDVIKVTEAKKALGDDGRDRFVTEYEKINDTVELDNVSTVLYQTAGGPTKVDAKYNYVFDDGFGRTKNETLVVKGNNTLAVNTIEGSGIHFRNDVNVVLQYWNRNTKEIDIMAGEGVDDLKDMVSIVNDITTNTDRYNDGVKKTYYVSALIENGLATDIVIFDSYNTYSVNRPVTPTGEADLEWNKADEEWTLWVPAGTDVSNLTTAQIQNWLLKAGCSEISKTRKGWDFLYKGMSYYEQIVNVKARETTVTVTYSAGGTASVDKPAAKVGDTVTVSCKANTGYELDYIEVNGTKIASSTFKMAVIPTSVYVAFKATAVVGENVTITVDPLLTSDNSRITVAGTVLASYADVTAKKGDTIVILPSTKVVNVTGVADGKITGNVTITVKDGFTWSELNELWMGVNDAGNLITEAIPASRMARAAVARAAEIPEGPIEIDKGWLGKISADTGATYTITVGPVTWTGVIGAADGATEWILTRGTVAEAKTAIVKIDSADVEKTNSATPDPVTDAKDVTAKVTALTSAPYAGDYEAVFSAWLSKAQIADGKRVLTASEIASALKDAGYTDAVVDLTNGKADVKVNGVAKVVHFSKDNYTIGVGDTDRRLYKVSYPGGADQYLKTIGATDLKLKGVTSGIAFLMPDTKIVSGTIATSNIDSVIAVTKEDDGTFSAKISSSATLDKDVNYIPAIKLDNFAPGGAIGTNYFTATYTDNVTDAAGAKVVGLDTSTDKYIKSGTVLTLTKHASSALTKGQVLIMTINGTETREITVDEDGKYTTGTVTVNNYNKGFNAGEQFTMEFELKDAGAVKLPVTLNGNPLTFAANGKCNLTGMKDMTVVYADADGKLVKVAAGVTADDGKGNITVTYKGQADADKSGTLMDDGNTGLKALAEKAKKVELFTAYEVKVDQYENSSVWAVYKTFNPSAETKLKDQYGTSADENVYFKAAPGSTAVVGTIYVQALNGTDKTALKGGIDLVWEVKADGTVDRSNITQVQGGYTSAKEADKAGIWKVDVTKNIDLTDATAFKKAAIVNKSVYDGITIASDITSAATKALTTSDLDITGNVTVDGKGNFVPMGEGAAANATAAVAESGNTVSLTVKVGEGKKIERIAAGPQQIGNMTVKLTNGWEITVPVYVAQKGGLNITNSEAASQAYKADHAYGTLTANLSPDGATVTGNYTWKVAVYAENINWNSAQELTSTSATVGLSSDSNAGTFFTGKYNGTYVFQVSATVDGDPVTAEYTLTVTEAKVAAFTADVSTAWGTGSHANTIPTISVSETGCTVSAAWKDSSDNEATAGSSKTADTYTLTLTLAADDGYELDSTAEYKVKFTESDTTAFSNGTITKTFTITG